MAVEVVQVVSVELLRRHPEKVYVFSDNLLRRGLGGQTAIRNEPNAYGVPTKRSQSLNGAAFFSDQEDERLAVVEALRELYVIAKSKTVVFPKAGLGTGMTQMASHSPKVYALMSSILKDNFGFDQNVLNDGTA